MSIPLFYRIFFLYIDPLICLSGIYLCFFDPQTFIQNGVPSVISSHISPEAALPPITKHLIMSLGSYSVFVFVMQILLLQQFKDAPGGMNVKIWRIVQFGILLIDLGLLYGSYVADSAAFWDLNNWKSGDWTNNGILGLVAFIRLVFLAGVGGVKESG